MHTIKLLQTYYLNISVQAANLSDCPIESNRKKIDSVARIESNRNFFCPNWNALEHTASFLCMDNKHGGKLFVIKQSKVRRLTAKCTKNAAASDTSNECVRDWLSFVCVAYMTY